ncbi:uncharacterized protein LOC119503559 [Sebastes umbrosus]|uniref:uncharacterized protein LOC119503559 n=1 Tax=Sebastes umbrosus TaxID=72105 RepID=UPI00189CB066|nr:uncharacterized protein LOC119503559 [Sebastes umbrosus]
MRVIIFSCLLAFILGCNVAAEIIHEIVKEKTSVTLRCSHSVEGDVTWSREINGRKVLILTAGDDGDIRHNDPVKRYSSLADNSLYIRRVNISDAGRFWCNNEPVVELTVIPSGATRLDATERTSVTMTCPHDVRGSHIVTWSSRGFRDLQNQKGFYVSLLDQTLTVTSVELGDSGLYYCDGKPAFYLNVIKDKKTPPTTSTTATLTAAATTTVTETDTTTTRKQRNTKKPRKKKNNTIPTTASTTTTLTAAATTTVTETATPYLWPMCVRTVVVILYLIIMISITVTTWIKARRTEATYNRNRKRSRILHHAETRVESG